MHGHAFLPLSHQVIGLLRIPVSSNGREDLKGNRRNITYVKSAIELGQHSPVSTW